jgi:hypothetical protein
MEGSNQAGLPGTNARTRHSCAINPIIGPAYQASIRPAGMILPAELGGFLGDAGAVLGRIAHLAMACNCWRCWLFACSFDDLARLMADGGSAVTDHWPRYSTCAVPRACAAVAGSAGTQSTMPVRTERITTQWILPLSPQPGEQLP